MVYNLDERATLFDDTTEVAQATLRELIAMALAWDEERFDRARIETVTQEVYGPDMIEEIADEAGIGGDVEDGHPS